MKKLGFTLAEVLITLGIIGVVAAVTIPMMITNYQKHVTVTQLKKAYTEFAQALQKAENEHGLMETWNFADFETAQDRTIYFGENYLFPYIKTIKRCMPSSNECWADDVVSLSNIAATELKNQINKTVSFTTVSGYSVYYWLHGSGMGMIYYVDINGLKAPNQLGRDIFQIQANWGKTTNKLGVFPQGLENNKNYNRDNLLRDLKNFSSKYLILKVIK